MLFELALSGIVLRDSFNFNTTKTRAEKLLTKGEAHVRLLEYCLKDPFLVKKKEKKYNQ